MTFIDDADDLILRFSSTDGELSSVETSSLKSKSAFDECITGVK